MAVLSHSAAGFSAELAANLADKQVQKRLSPAARKAFFKIASAWKIRDEEARQLLGGISNGTFYQLKAGEAKAPLDQDRLVRASLLLGIFKALNTLYSPKLADAWISLANRNPMFAGQTPLAYMIKGGQPAMLRVRQLLDARRLAA
jgi:Antitoxin Xre-like helix-turn-helix domain